MPNTYQNTTLSAEFFKPLNELYSLSSSTYACTVLADLDYLRLGISRCLSDAKSGRAFIQEEGDFGTTDITLDHFFKSLKSKRRLENLVSLNSLLAEQVSTKVNDPFEQYKELNKWDIYAVDGHYQEHATHDPIHIRGGKESRPVTGQFFRLDLRSHHMSLLDTAIPAAGKKKEHDAKLIKRMTAEALRNNAPKGRKVMLVWDKACICYATWHKLKMQNAVYFVTMEKSNSAAMNCSEDLCDHTNPRNEGIVKEQLIGLGGEMMRRIVYKNPTDDKEYTYITNEMKLPAYLIVTFYKHRWDIEKIYYQFKSKFNERKSWASSLIAKRSHAVFQCLLHNLLLLLEEAIEKQGVHDKVSEKRAVQRKKPEPVGYINKIVQRASHRTHVLIRWLRNHLQIQASYTHALGRLKVLYARDI